MWGHQIRWRAVVLFCFYGLGLATISALLGVSSRSIKRWVNLFNTRGVVSKEHAPRPFTWRSEVIDFIDMYVKSEPMFILEELQAELEIRFPEHSEGFSISNICKVLRHYKLWKVGYWLSRGRTNFLPSKLHI